MRAHRRLMCLSAVLCAAAVGMSSALAPGEVGPCPVVNAQALTPLLEAAHVRRIDFIGIGDSNQGNFGFGWDHGWQAALAQRYPMYATGWLGQGPFALGYHYICLGGLATAGAPAPLRHFHDIDHSVFAPSYAWHAAGFTAETVQFYLEPGIPLDVGARLVLRRQIALFPLWTFGTGGSHIEFLRRDDDHQWLFVSPPIPNGVPQNVPPFLVDTVDQQLAPVVPADPSRRGRPLEWLSCRPGFADTKGPVFIGLSCVENADENTGFSYTTLAYGGGKSLRDIAFALKERRARPNLVNTFQRIRARQPQADKMVAFTINSGLNDCNEAEESVGASPTLPGDSPAAFEDNARVLIAAILSAWAEAGGDESEVYFTLTGSHLLSDADATGRFIDCEARLRQYRRVFARLAAEMPRTAAVILDQLTSAEQTSSQTWYASADDLAHLSESGYEGLCEIQLAALEACASCRVDLTGDGAVDAEDLYAFHQSPLDLDLDAATTIGDAAFLIRQIRGIEVSDLTFPVFY